MVLVVVSSSSSSVTCDVWFDMRAFRRPGVTFEVQSSEILEFREHPPLNNTENLKQNGHKHIKV